MLSNATEALANLCEDGARSVAMVVQAGALRPLVMLCSRSQDDAVLTNAARAVGR